MRTMLEIRTSNLQAEWRCKWLENGEEFAIYSGPHPYWTEMVFTKEEALALADVIRKHV